MNKLKSVLAVMMLLLWVSCANAATVPQIINYQGTLTNKDGTKANGPVSMVFSVYNVATGGTPLWSEAWGTTPVIVTNGSFNVMLGAITPFSATFFSDNQSTYLGIKVGTDAEMLPRQQFASVGYAFAAGNAFTAANGIPNGGIIMWSGAVNQIPSGWALCDGTNGTPDLRDRFVMGAGKTYETGATGGGATHTHLGADHTHSDDHVHGYSGTSTNANTDQHDVADGNNHSKTSASHTHNYSGATNSKNAAGYGLYTGAADRNLTTGAGSSFPPYYALAFIMKISPSPLLTPPKLLVP